jgi:DNA-binding NarL/FixJ family response regulator
MIYKPEKTRIMMVDDHPIVREGMALFLNSQEDLSLCCQAATAEEALSALAKCPMTLVIIDISLNKDSGLDLIKVLRRRYPALLLLALSLHDESIFAERALQAGASGYVMKHVATHNILQAVRKVLAGEIYLSDAMHNQLAQKLRTPDADGTSAIAGLTEREFEIFYLLGLGFGTRQISEKVNRSIKTIEAHRASLKDKLNFDTGIELVRFAVRWLDNCSHL